MDIILANFINDDGAALEHRLAAGRAKLHVHFDDPSNPVLPDELCRIADAIILYSAGRPLGREPSEFPRCKVLVREGVGYDTVDLAGWGAAGVPVCNVPDYGTSEVADHALALMLALLRGTATYHDALRSDSRAGWRFNAAPSVRRVRGLTFGVVGMGRIGTAAAMRARGFGMEIAFYDPGLPSGMEIALDARRAGSLRELVETCDVLSLHCPATAATKNMIDAALLRHAKPGLVLINTARGSLVDLDALHDALHAGQIAAARARRASHRTAGCLPKAVPGVAGARGVARWTADAVAARGLLQSREPGRSQDQGAWKPHSPCWNDGEAINCVNTEFLKRRTTGLKPARTGRVGGGLHVPVWKCTLLLAAVEGALLTIRLSALAMRSGSPSASSARWRAATAMRPWPGQRPAMSSSSATRRSSSSSTSSSSPCPISACGSIPTTRRSSR